MAKQIIPVELDDETVGYLAVLGKPIEVLSQMAYAAADNARRPGHPKREQTNESLRIERGKFDASTATEQFVVDLREDEVVRVARQRADGVVQTARDVADRERRPQMTATETRSARAVVEQERADADAVVESERAARKSGRADFLAAERDSTDKNLVGERAGTDALIGDQREANGKMLSAALQAEAAKERAENNERALRAVAEFREMFIGVLGHDLRNPLGSTVMAAGLLLQRGNLDDRDSKTVARIVRSSQRMTRMITQLLDLTRARLGGGLPIELQPTDLHEICRNVVSEFDVTIELEVEGDVTGTWDPDRLTEVLSNLVGNGIEYAAPDTAVIVKVHADESEVVVEINNEGEPIPADVLPFIFEPFRRAKQREKSATGNLGLGLYIAKQVVLSHGGTLDAHSADGITTFVMRLPRHSADPLS